jgi:hypothetical protein
MGRISNPRGHRFTPKVTPKGTSRLISVGALKDHQLEQNHPHKELKMLIYHVESAGLFQNVLAKNTIREKGQPSDRDNWLFRIGFLIETLRLEVSEVWLSSSSHQHIISNTKGREVLGLSFSRGISMSLYLSIGISVSL